MSEQQPAQEPPRLSSEDAQALIKAIEEVEREEAEQQAREREEEKRKSA